MPFYYYYYYIILTKLFNVWPGNSGMWNSICSDNSYRSVTSSPDRHSLEIRLWIYALLVLPASAGEKRECSGMPAASRWLNSLHFVLTEVVIGHP